MDLERNNNSGRSELLRSETPFADEVLQNSDVATDRTINDNDVQLGTRLSAMGAEIERLTESVSLLTENAKELALQTPHFAQRKIRQKIRANPFASVAYAVIGGFLITRHYLK